MKKVYIARRIPKQANPQFVLDVRPDMSLEQVFEIYTQKIYIQGLYIYNGPWILRPPISGDVFTLNTLPKSLTPMHVWDMVKSKIESSDVFIGIINSKSYGTIAELGYACNCPNMAVYVIPDTNLTDEELQDLWFVFQMAKKSEHLWCEEDIKGVKEFAQFNIHSLNDYKSLISKIVPNFLKK